MSDDVLLIFPPLWLRPLHPYCSLPYLSGFLQARGIGVSQLDLNLVYHRHYLREETLERIRSELLKLADQEPGARALRQTAMLHVPREKDIQEAVSILTGKLEGFLDLPTYRKAWEVVDGAIAQVNAYHRVGLAWANGDLTSSRARGAWEDLRAFFADELASRPSPAGVLGISLVASTQVSHGREIAAIARELFPDVRVVMGGAQVTCAAPYLEECLPWFRGADWLVTHDGEEALEAICRGEDLAHTPNSIALVNGCPHRSPITRPMDIGSTPPPSYKELPLGDYLSPTRVLYIQGSRGCYWAKCTFCPIHRLSLQYQARPGRMVARDMAELQRSHGVDHFYFVDEVLSPAFLRQLGAAIKDLRLTVHWTGEARLEKRLERGLLRELRSAGCCKLFFGLESGSARVLQRMNKGIDLKTASRVVRECFLEDIAVGLFCIIAFPGESRTDLMATVGLILDHRPVLDRPGLSIDFTPFRLFRPARIAESPRAFGITIAPPDPAQGPGLLLQFSEEGGPSEDDKRQIKAAVDRTMADQFRYLVMLHEPDDLVYLCALHAGRYPRLVTRRDLSAHPLPPAETACLHVRSSFHWEVPVRRHGELLVPDTYTGRLEPATEQELELLRECAAEHRTEAIVPRMAAKWGISEEAGRSKVGEVLKHTMAFGRAFLLACADRGGRAGG